MSEAAYCSRCDSEDCRCGAAADTGFLALSSPVVDPEPSASDEPETLEAKPSRRTSYTAAELLETEFPEPRYAVPGILAEGLNFEAGPPKMGKSWKALNIALAVAAGGHALGKIPVEQGEVLYLALEDPPRRLKERLRMILRDEPAPVGLHFETSWRRLGAGGEEDIRAWLEAHPDARLVVVDVFAKVRPQVSDRADRYAADYHSMEPLKEIADDFGIAVFVLHHTRKAASEDYVDAVSGTQGLAGAADAILVLRRARGQADAELHVTGRDVEEKSYALRFDPLVGSWTLLGDAAEYAIGETRRQILDVLRAHGALTPKGVADVSAVPHELAKKTLQRMLADGQVIAEDGRYSVPSDPVSAVPSVPESLIDLSTNGAGGQRDAGDTDTEGDVPEGSRYTDEAERLEMVEKITAAEHLEAEAAVLSGNADPRRRLPEARATRDGFGSFATCVRCPEKRHTFFRDANGDPICPKCKAELEEVAS